MFAHLDGGGGNERVRMIGNRDRHRVDIFLLFLKHLTPILIKLGVGVRLAGLLRLVLVGITNRHDFFRTAVTNIALAFASGADAADSQFIAAAGYATTRLSNRREGCSSSGCNGGVIKETSAC